MKTIYRSLISLILIAILINPVLGFPGYGGNTSGAITSNITQNGQENIDLANATQSDQNIKLTFHLIEVDAAQLEAQNQISVRETLLFQNDGDKNFSGTLRTWVPDGIEGLNVGKVPMTMDGSVIPINAIQNGNVISWQDYITSNNPLPPMYAVVYVLSAEPKGTFGKSKYFTKKLVYPTLVNKVPLSVVLKVTKGIGETITLKDELGNSISSSEKPSEEENSVIYNWESPQFKEINIEISKPAIDLSQISIYLIIGLLIVLVLSYPVIRKKSPKLMEFEAKIKNSLKRGSVEQQETEEEISEEEDISEEKPEGKADDAEKSELVAKLEELEKDYASGNLIDEEYEELRNSYKEKLKKINKRNQ